MGAQKSEDPESSVSPREFELAVLDREDVRIVVRAPHDKKLKPYHFQRKAADTTSVTEWLEARVLPLVDGYPVEVISGGGVAPHGRTRMSTLRNSYQQ